MSPYLRPVPSLRVLGVSRWRPIGTTHGSSMNDARVLLKVQEEERQVQGSRDRRGHLAWFRRERLPWPEKERGPGCNVSAHGDVADQPPAKQPATTSPRPPQENPAGQYGGASVVSATQGAHSCSEPEPNQRPRATIPTRQWGARPRRLHWQVDLGEVVAPQRHALAALADEERADNPAHSK